MLWDWHFAHTKTQSKVIADSDLATLIEYWFPFSEIEYTRKLGIWCDGIPLLSVSSINRTAFSIIGVGYFPFLLGAFELCFHFNHRRDRIPEWIEIRFGELDDADKLVLYPHTKAPELILSRRPVEIQRWAVAVEMTTRQQ